MKSTLNCIGLCFSGGGYRASFFNLGVLSYLNRAQYDGKCLLDRVEMLSTVSGGTFTGLAFAKARTQQNYSFDSFYKLFYETFEPENDSLIDDATAKLIDDKVWGKHPHKKRSMINAMALTYSEMEVFKGNFGMFMNDKDEGIYKVCFNATDFTFGLPFRFQNKPTFSNHKIKNKLISKLQADIPLGDILAASSCFPVGFEPIVFPDDFYRDHKNEDFLNLKKIDIFTNGIGLMDGGITDNQGIGSMMNAYHTSYFEDKMDLMIVNDVSSSTIENPYTPESEKVEERGTIKTLLIFIMNSLKVYGLAVLLFVLGILLIILCQIEMVTGLLKSVLLIIAGVVVGAGTVIAIVGFVIQRAKTKVIEQMTNQFEKIPKYLQDNLLEFENLEVNLVIKMIKERISSSSLMIYDIFSKQLRRINYDFLYKQNASLNGIVVTSMIHKFNEEYNDYNSSDLEDLQLPEPSENLKKAATAASKTGTQLWWTDKDKAADRMDKLIATGQFTTCYNLLIHVRKLEKEGIINKNLQELKEQLITDWKAFNDDELMMMT